MQKTNGIYYKNRHSCFLLQYHLVLVMKYRRKALVGEVRECVYKTLRDGTKVRVAAVVETVRMPDGTRPHATEKGPEAIAPMPQGGSPAGSGGPGRGHGGTAKTV